VSPHIAPKLAGDPAKAGAEAASAGYSIDGIPNTPSRAGAVDNPRLPERTQPSIGDDERLGGLHGIRRLDHIKADFRLDDWIGGGEWRRGRPREAANAAGI
jgi:hypothetical protein